MASIHQELKGGGITLGGVEFDGKDACIAFAREHLTGDLTCNLASDPAYAQECRRFEAHLHGLLDPLEVDARARREQNNLIARFGGREAALKWGNPGPTPAPESTAQQPTGAQA